jgi:uncharacterized membrane protein
MALLYVFIGLVIAATAFRVRARRGATLFWGLIALVFLAGDWMPEELVGAIVLVLAVLAGMGAVGRATHDSADTAEPVAAIGDRVFWPVLAIPLVTVVAVLTGKVFTQPPNALLDAQQLALLSLAMACAIALAFALHLTRARPQLAFAAGADLLDAIGWAAVLPLTLAMLGTVFAKAHVGDAVASLMAQAVPIDSRFACVLAFAFAMLALTAVMGNAFAAFPVVMGGIGLPLLVARHGANPAVLGAIGMLTGYCGTLLTPMAANYNIVPVALLELRDDWAVIKAQAPTGVALFGVNVVLLNLLAF